MKFLKEQKILNLIPYNGDPSKWWDGIDSNQIYAFEDLIPYESVKSQSVNSAYSAVRLSLKIGARGSVE